MPRLQDASIADSSQPLNGLTKKQNQQLFKIYLRNAEQERTAAAVKARVEVECLQRESDARIAAANAAPLRRSAPAAPRVQPDRKDDIIDEIPLEVKNTTLKFAGLPQEEIANIYHNKFRPINLYRLRHVQSLNYERSQNQERIGIEDRMSRLKERSGLYRTFGKSFYDVWSESFTNYSLIMASLFGPTSPNLHFALIRFYGDVLQLSKVYDWHEALLPMAIQLHSYIAAKGPSDPANWTIPPGFQGRFCTPMTLIGMSSLINSGQTKRKRSTSPPSRRVERQPLGGDTNNPLFACNSFNKGVCGWANCKRVHKCKRCGSKEHGQKSCF